jgi:hypothetical protein
MAEGQIPIAQGSREINDCRTRKVEKWGSRRKRVDRIVVDNDSSVVVVRWGGRKVKPVRKRRWMTR